MMKLSEFEGEKALDVLADLLEPAVEIMADKAIKAAIENKENLKAVTIAIKEHKKAVIKILAILDDEPIDNYKVTVLTLPAKLLELFNDPNLVDLFRSQGQDAKPSSGSATENTEEKER